MQPRVCRFLCLGVVAGLLWAGCEEGPDQVFKPLPEGFKPATVNGFDPTGYRPDGKQPFEFEQSGKQENTADLCEADEIAKRWATMVKEPVQPTIGAGGLDLRGKPKWAGMTIDDAQQQLCQAYVYQTNLYYWGDNAEMLAVFDTKTRLISTLILLGGYEGKITAGKYEIGTNQAVKFDGVKLNNLFAPKTLAGINSALLKQFRPEMPNPEARDCYEANTCYAYDWQTLKVIILNDLALALIIEPDGQKVVQIEMSLKRAFSFASADVAFEATPAPATGLPPQPKIPFSSACSPTLGTDWGYIKSKCLGSDPLEKAKISADSSGELAFVDMGGLSLYLKRPSLKADAILPDDVKPADSDVIAAMTFGIDYDGWIKIHRGDLMQRFFARLVADVKAMVPALNGPGTTTAGGTDGGQGGPGGSDAGVAGEDAGTGPGGPMTWAQLLQGSLDKLQPDGDPTKIKLGSQKINECVTADSCTDQTLILRTHQIVLDAIAKAGASAPAAILNPNFLVERYLAELLAEFNDGKTPTPDQLYYYPTSDSADILVGVFARQFNGKRYAIRTAYHNKSDQLIFLFFKQGPMRTEDVLWQDASLQQYDGKPGDGTFRLWNFARSPRVGLGTKLLPTKEFPETRKATIGIKLGALPVDVLVSYHKEDSLSGFSIPLEGQRDKFETAAYYGFSGNVIAGGIWAKGGIVRAVSSSAFYDKLDFCGVKVGLWDEVEPFLGKLPADCDKIVTFSENGKLITAVSTYVAQEPFKIGLRVWITAGRIDQAYYWAEQ